MANQCAKDTCFSQRDSAVMALLVGLHLLRLESLGSSTWVLQQECIKGKWKVSGPQNGPAERGHVNRKWPRNLFRSVHTPSWAGRTGMAFTSGLDLGWDLDRPRMGLRLSFGPPPPNHSNRRLELSESKKCQNRPKASAQDKRCQKSSRSVRTSLSDNLRAKGGKNLNPST